MAKNWGVILPARAADWGVPPADITALAGLTGSADAALSAAMNEATRTPVATAQCKAAFDGLEEAMRDIKRRHFFTPPLTEADLVGLGLSPHDTAATPGHAPSAQAAVETFLTGRHELGIRLVYVSGDPHDKANKGFRVWYAASAPGETPPANPEQLNKSFFTRRKKDVIVFGFGDSGKTASIAVQRENNGVKGEFGPMVSAVIP
jgi:hypothetical protein